MWQSSPDRELRWERRIRNRRRPTWPAHSHYGRRYCRGVAQPGWSGFAGAGHAARTRRISPPAAGRAGSRLRGSTGKAGRRKNRAFELELSARLTAWFPGLFTYRRRPVAGGPPIEVTVPSERYGTLVLQKHASTACP